MLPESDEAWTGWRRAVPAAGLIGVCVAASVSEVSAEEGQILCPFRLATGGWCPGCGGTRALRHLMHGDLSMSLSLNPLLLVVFSQVVALSAFFMAAPEKARSWFREHNLSVLKFNVVIAVAIWVVRLYLDKIPAPFEVAAPIGELWRQIF